MKQRKQVRVTLPAEMAGQFAESKADAEHRMMVQLSDSQYAAMLIGHALKPASGKTTGMS